MYNKTNDTKSVWIKKHSNNNQKIDSENIHNANKKIVVS